MVKITIQYETIEKKSLTWTRKLSIQLNLAHVARKKETKTTNASAPLIQYRFRSVRSKSVSRTPRRNFFPGAICLGGGASNDILH